jgi:hypothetical protein
LLRAVVESIEMTRLRELLWERRLLWLWEIVPPIIFLVVEECGFSPVIKVEGCWKAELELMPSIF